MPQIKPHLRNLYRIKSEERARSSFLHLDMNEGIPGLPEDFVKEVLSEINASFLSTYPDRYGTLQEKVAVHNNLNYKNIGLSNGSDAAIKYIFDAYISVGDKVLLTDPTFAMYPVYCEMFNAKPIIVEYNSDLSFPVREFMSKVSSGIKMAVIVNPNNPTGSALNRRDLISVVKKAAANDVLVVADEAYYYFYHDTVIDQVREYNNLIVLRTFSKLFGMAAIRLGYVAACSKITEDLRKVKPTYDVNGVGVLFGEKILDKPELIQNLIEIAREGKRYLIQKLSEENIEHEEGNANFVLIKCYDRVDEIVRRLEENNILVKGQFEQNFLKDYIRVTVGSKVIMEQFWKDFIAIWKTKD